MRAVINYIVDSPTLYIIINIYFHTPFPPYKKKKGGH
nr:MAG TPA: hypothetical protein [Bacteriophage sp.]